MAEGVNTVGGETSLIKPIVSEGSHGIQKPDLIQWSASVGASSGWVGHPEARKASIVREE